MEKAATMNGHGLNRFGNQDPLVRPPEADVERRLSAFLTRPATFRTAVPIRLSALRMFHLQSDRGAEFSGDGDAIHVFVAKFRKPMRA